MNETLRRLYPSKVANRCIPPQNGRVSYQGRTQIGRITAGIWNHCGVQMARRDAVKSTRTTSRSDRYSNDGCRAGWRLQIRRSGGISVRKESPGFRHEEPEANLQALAGFSLGRLVPMPVATTKRRRPSFCRPPRGNLLQDVCVSHRITYAKESPHDTVDAHHQNSDHPFCRQGHAHAARDAGCGKGTSSGL